MLYLILMNLIYDELKAVRINKQETNGCKWVTAMTVGNNEMMGMGRRYVMQGKQDDDYAVMIMVVVVVIMAMMLATVTLDSVVVVEQRSCTL